MPGGRPPQTAMRIHGSSISQCANILTLKTLCEHELIEHCETNMLEGAVIFIELINAIPLTLGIKEDDRGYTWRFRFCSVHIHIICEIPALYVPEFLAAA